MRVDSQLTLRKRFSYAVMINAFPSTSNALTCGLWQIDVGKALEGMSMEPLVTLEAAIALFNFPEPLQRIDQR